MTNDTPPVARCLQTPKRPYAKRKEIRLNPETYRMGYVFSVTINTLYRAPLFTGLRAFNIALRCLVEAATKYRARVYAYCFMPDHVHLLAQTPAGVGFDDFVSDFKQRSGLGLRNLTKPAVWQPRYFDHALRSHEGFLAVARYIWGNPVRAGLAVAPDDYPYSGSLEWPRTWFGA